MQIGITFPVYHANKLHVSFTSQALESVRSSKHDIHILAIENYSALEYSLAPDEYKLHESVKKFEIENNPLGNHVGGAWNLGIERLLKEGCDYVLVPNNDVVFHKDCIDNLVKFAQDHPEFILWTAAEWHNLRTIKSIKPEDLSDGFDEHPHFSCFMVDKRTIDTIGLFDEKMKVAYFEDGDYHYRIVLSGNRAAKTASARFYHFGSRTIKVDDELNRNNKRTYEYNREHLKSKWGIDFHGVGFDPPEEMLKFGYKHPYNIKKLNWKDC